jgi:hypothetical protein
VEAYGAREKGASRVGVWAGEFFAVRKEQEGVFGKESRVILCKFRAGSMGGCSEREAHGENTFFVTL